MFLTIKSGMLYMVGLFIDLFNCRLDILEAIFFTENIDFLNLVIIS